MRRLASVLILAAIANVTLAATPNPADQIDALLAADWQAQKLAPNAPARDEVFVRRLYLDVAGRIPTYRETETFLGSKEPNMRAALIDHLLAGDGYVQHFFNFWADLLRAQSRGDAAGSTTGSAYVNFIKNSLRTNKPYDQFVRELITRRCLSQRHMEAFGLGEFLLVVVKGEELRCTQVKSTGHVQDVKPPVTALQSVSRGEPLCFIHHIRQIGGFNDQPALGDRRLEKRPVLRSLSCLQRPPEFRETECVSQFEVSERVQANGSGALRRPRHGTWAVDIGPIE